MSDMFLSVATRSWAARPIRHWRQYAIGAIPNAFVNFSLKADMSIHDASATSATATFCSRFDPRSLMPLSRDSIVLLCR